jgi:hypothetical protein
MEARWDSMTPNARMAAMGLKTKSMVVYSRWAELSERDRALVASWIEHTRFDRMVTMWGETGKLWARKDGAK